VIEAKLDNFADQVVISADDLAINLEIEEQKKIICAKQLKIGP